MAIKLIANYSKRLGLPGYSSHQYSVSVETELNTTDDIPGAAARLYRTLQDDVDRQMQQTGFVPPSDYGMEPAAKPAAPQPNTQQHAQTANQGPPSSQQEPDWKSGPAWRCSDKQRELIIKLADEHQIERAEIEQIATDLMGKRLCELNKLEASSLIDELLDTYGAGSRGTQRRGGNPAAYSRQPSSRRAA